MHTIGLKVSSKNDGNPYMPVGKGESATYHIGNAQDGGSLYYHDQFVGMTRLNVYSGLLGGIIYILPFLYVTREYSLYNSR